MLVLGWFGFKEGLNVVQSEATLHGEWVMFSLFPVIGVILGLPVLRMYKLRSKDVQIMAEYNQGNITKEQADQLLEGRYTK
jgi:Na+/melibiose symporter-like transporter